MEEYTSPAFYMVPAIDSYKENVIYVNQAQTAELYPTLAHEGYPGHLYQNVYYAAKGEDPIRYILDYPGYSGEAEKLMDSTNGAFWNTTQTTERTPAPRFTSWVIASATGTAET